MKILAAVLAAAGVAAHSYHIDTDEWLTAGRFRIGSNSQTAYLALDFNHEVTIVPGVGDC